MFSFDMREQNCTFHDHMFLLICAIQTILPLKHVLHPEPPKAGSGTAEKIFSIPPQQGRTGMGKGKEQQQHRKQDGRWPQVPST
jgi:hypothetical protein